MMIKSQDQPIVTHGLLVNNFTELYNEYFPRVYNYVCYRVNNYSDADDLTSLIFYKLFEKQGSYCSGKGPLFAWVFSIARNTVTDYYRRRQHNTYAPLELYENLADPGLSPVDIIENNEVRHQLRHALALLSNRERDLIALKFWSGMTNRQVAKITGLSESNIGVILFRTMRHMRQVMESQGVNLDD